MDSVYIVVVIYTDSYFAGSADPDCRSIIGYTIHTTTVSTDNDDTQVTLLNRRSSSLVCRLADRCPR